MERLTKDVIKGETAPYIGICLEHTHCREQKYLPQSSHCDNSKQPWFFPPVHQIKYSSMETGPASKGLEDEKILILCCLRYSFFSIGIDPFPHWPLPTLKSSTEHFIWMLELHEASTRTEVSKLCAMALPGEQWNEPSCPSYWFSWALPSWILQDLGATILYLMKSHGIQDSSTQESTVTPVTSILGVRSSGHLP